MNLSSCIRYFVFIFLFVFFGSCSQQNEEDKISINTAPELTGSNFSFDFNNGVNISTNSVKQASQPHFFYFFTPT